MSETITAQMHTILDMLRRLPARERLRVIALVLPEVERELNTTIPTPSSTLDTEAEAKAEAEFRQSLVDMGMLAEVKEQPCPYERKLPEPIEVPGTPLSEIIIAERR